MGKDNVVFSDYSVREIHNKETYYYLLNIHYAKRIPSISFAYGLFFLFDMVGIVTYGTPSSPPLRKGLAGEDHIKSVLELNRLCLKNNKYNEASYLVSRSLKLLPQKKIIISFADTSQGHAGTVYQACNFTYHGLSAKRTDWALKSRPNLHGATIADMSRGRKHRAVYMRETYGDDFYLKPRPRKHRYIYLTGPKRWNKKTRGLLRYIECLYPKNNT